MVPPSDSLPTVEWELRETAPDLRAWYRREGYWTDATLTDLVVGGLEQNRDLDFRVWSQTRPTRHRTAGAACPHRGVPAATGAPSRPVARARQGGSVAPCQL